MKYERHAGLVSGVTSVLITKLLPPVRDVTVYLRAMVVLQVTDSFVPNDESSWTKI